MSLVPSGLTSYGVKKPPFGLMLSRKRSFGNMTLTDSDTSTATTVTPPLPISAMDSKTMNKFDFNDAMVNFGALRPPQLQPSITHHSTDNKSTASLSASSASSLVTTQHISSDNIVYNISDIRPTKKPKLSLNYGAINNGVSVNNGGTVAVAGGGGNGDVTMYKIIQLPLSTFLSLQNQTIAPTAAPATIPTLAAAPTPAMMRHRPTPMPMTVGTDRLCLRTPPNAPTDAPSPLLTMAAMPTIGGIDRIQTMPRATLSGDSAARAFPSSTAVALPTFNDLLSDTPTQQSKCEQKKSVENTGDTHIKVENNNTLHLTTKSPIVTSVADTAAAVQPTPPKQSTIVNDGSSNTDKPQKRVQKPQPSTDVTLQFNVENHSRISTRVSLDCKSIRKVSDAEAMSALWRESNRCAVWTPKQVQNFIEKSKEASSTSQCDFDWQSPDWEVIAIPTTIWVPKKQIQQFRGSQI